MLLSRHQNAGEDHIITTTTTTTTTTIIIIIIIIIIQGLDLLACSGSEFIF
jgi:hypothetical protein